MAVESRTMLWFTVVCVTLLLSGLCTAEFDSLSLLNLPSGTVLNETTGTIPACVVVSGTRASDETVTFTIVSGTATFNVDFTVGSMNVVTTITFTPLETQKCLNLTIFEDNNVEETESFSISLLGGGQFAFIQIFILDNLALINLSFDRSVYFANELGPVQLCVMAEGENAERHVEFTLETVDGSATRGVDYIPQTLFLTLSPTNQVPCGSIPILNDGRVEEAENFTATVSSLGDVLASAVVIISDIHGAKLSLNSTSVNVSEVDSSETSVIPVCVNLVDDLNGLDRKILLLLNTADDTASGGSDYQPLTDEKLVIPADSEEGSKFCLNVTIVGDDIYELNENFTVTFTVVNPNDEIEGEVMVTVTILEDECEPLDNPDNGLVEISGYVEGSVATYSCLPGYDNVGVDQRVCGSDGGWNGSQPTCNSVDCGSLNDPVNGSVVGPTSTFPSMVTYSCDEGFELEGEASRMCQANGKWTGSDPMCVLSPPIAEQSSSDDDGGNILAIAVGAGVGGLLIIVLVVIVIFALCLWSQRKKKSGKYEPTYTVYDNTARGEIAADGNHDSGPVGTFEHSATAATFEQPSTTEPEMPPESDIPVGSPLDHPDGVAEQPDLQEPPGYNTVVDIPEKTYYLREVDSDLESEEEEEEEEEEDRV